MSNELYTYIKIDKTILCNDGEFRQFTDLGTTKAKSIKTYKTHSSASRMFNKIRDNMSEGTIAAITVFEGDILNDDFSIKRASQIRLDAFANDILETISAMSEI